MNAASLCAHDFELRFDSLFHEDRAFKLHRDARPGQGRCMAA
jgi:hypothetical protein